MSKCDSRYQRTDRYGVEKTKLVVWLPTEDKARLRGLADDRREPMSETAARAITEFIDRAEQKTD